MQIQNPMRSGTRRACSIALVALFGAVLGATGCNEANGTKQVPGTFPPEAEIDRMYPEPTGDGDMGDGDMGDGDMGDGDMGDGGMADGGMADGGDGADSGMMD